jgi:hypothetical protein
MHFAICLHAFLAKEMMAWKFDEINTCKAHNLDSEIEAKFK